MSKVGYGGAGLGVSISYAGPNVRKNLAARSRGPRGFFLLLNGGELAIVYCFVFLYFWVAGCGEWSLDRLREPASALSPSRA
jgi:uncharacterized membrane protein YphA (DoxX/SURF4 family)